MTAVDTSLLALRRPNHPSPAQIAARLSRYQCNFLNRFIRQNDVADLIQFGCADSKLPQRLKVGAYLGVDAAPEVVAQCRQSAYNPTRQFVAAGELPAGAAADLALSIQAIRRLVAEVEFNAHFRALFDTARRHVIIQGNDGGPGWGGDARRFTAHVQRYFPAWRLAAQLPSPFPPAAAAGDFFVYARGETGCIIPALALI